MRRIFLLDTNITHGFLKWKENLMLMNEDVILRWIKIIWCMIYSNDLCYAHITVRPQFWP